MDTHLVVTVPFAAYAVGDVIDDSKLVADLSSDAETAAKTVRVSAADMDGIRSPKPKAKTTSGGEG